MTLEGSERPGHRESSSFLSKSVSGQAEPSSVGVEICARVRTREIKMSFFAFVTKMVPEELEKLVEMPLEKATELAKAKGYIVRLVEVDGEPYSVEAAHRDDRVNFKVEKGLIVEVGIG